MAAAKGNKYAEKWKVEDARELAHKAYDAVDEETFFMSTIAIKCDVYRELFGFLLKKFNDDEEVFLTLKKMHTKAESIIWSKSAMGEIDKAVGIFALKALHGLYESSHQIVESQNKTEHSGQITTFELPKNGRE